MEIIDTNITLIIVSHLSLNREFMQGTSKQWMVKIMIRFSRYVIFYLVLTGPLFATTTFKINPFYWNLNMSGRVQVSYKKVHVDQNKPAGILAIAITKDKFNLFADAIYSRVSNNYSRPPYSATIVNKFGIFTGALGYEVYRWQFSDSPDINLIRFEPYFGARYTLKNTDVTVRVLGMEASMSHHQNWTDPILGLNLSYPFVKDWRLMWGGDIGGTNTTSDYSYQTYALIEYHPHRFLTHFSLYAGYKILDQHYIHGHDEKHFDWNVKLSGPLVGIAVSF